MPRIRVNAALSIDADELRFSFTTSGGPGGQNVNKVATKAVLEFNVRRSPSLSTDQRARVQESLTTRVNRDGILRLTCSRHRSQDANRREATAVLCRLLADALRPRRVRKATRPTAASIDRRLREKTARRARKRVRRKPTMDE